MLWICGIVLTTLCIFHVEAQSLICSNTTASACPDTEVTLCTCSITSLTLVWSLPGGAQIAFGGQDSVDTERSVGVYTAVVTNDTGGRESVLTYTATDALMNVNIECLDLGSADPPVIEATIVTFAELSNAPSSITWINETSTYNSATIQWTGPSDNGGSDITNYTITISPSTSGDSTCPLGSCNVSSNTLMYNITELDHRTKYNVSVAAINCIGTGSSVFLEDPIDIIARVSNIPRNVMISKLNDSSLTVAWRCPIYDPLSPPVDNYTVTVNDEDPVTVVDDGSCSYSVTIAVSPQDAPYSVSVVATNDVGDSDAVLVDNIMSVQDIITVTTNNTIFNTIIFTFDATIDDTTSVTVTLIPNGMGEGSIGDGVEISGLMPDTLYTYTVSFVYNNILYSIQSSARTSIGSTIVISSIMATTSSVTASSQFSTVSTATMMITTGATTTPDPTTAAVMDMTTIIIIVVVVVVAAIAALIVTVVIICICIKVKSRSSKGDDGVALRGEYRKKHDEPAPYVEKETGQSGAMYQDPSTIERQQAPTGDFYAVPDKKSTGSRRQPPAAPTELATYQDPSTIQHETAPTGALYAMPDKKSAGVAKPDDRTYAALDFENGTGSASTSFQSGKPRAPDVLYSEVQPQ